MRLIYCVCALCGRARNAARFPLCRIRDVNKIRSLSVLIMLNVCAGCTLPSFATNWEEVCLAHLGRPILQLTTGQVPFLHTKIQNSNLLCAEVGKLIHHRILDFEVYLYILKSAYAF